MPDFTKKAASARPDVLAPTEEYFGATYALPAGRFARIVGSSAAGVIGGAIAEYASNKKQPETDSNEVPPGDGMAAAMPHGLDVVLAVTNERLLVFSLARLKGVPKDLLTEYPIGAVASIAAQPKKLMTRLEITFVDGSRADFDAQKPAKPSRLVDGFQRATGRN